MNRNLRLLLPAFALVAAVHSSGAQTAQKFSIQGSGLYTKLSGDAFAAVKNGIGGELQLRYTPSAWSFGFGVQYTRHDGAGEDAALLFERINFMGVFFEPRRVIDVGWTKAAPYISGRFAFSRMDFVARDFSNVGLRLDTDNPSGPTANGGGGVLVRVGSRVNLDLGVTVGYTKFGNGRLTLRNAETGEVVNSDDGTPLDVPVKFGSGLNIVGRVGLAIGIGG